MDQQQRQTTVLALDNKLPINRMTLTFLTHATGSEVCADLRPDSSSPVDDDCFWDSNALVLRRGFGLRLTCPTIEVALIGRLLFGMIRLVNPKSYAFEYCVALFSIV